MSTPPKYYDQHTLYVDCGAISKKNLDRILGDAIMPLKQELKNSGIKLDTFHELKLVINKDGVSLGKAYLWVSDPQLYNILNGKNPDGTDRTNTYPDPDWVEPASPIGGEIADFKIPAGMNWAELVDEDEEQRAPMITVKLPALVQFNEFEYSTEEAKLAKEIIDNEWYRELLLAFYNQVKINDKKEKDWHESEIRYNEFLDDFLKQGFPRTATLKAMENIITGLNGKEIGYDKLYDTVENIVDENDDTPLLSGHKIQISGAYVLNVEDTQLKNVLTAKVYPAILDPIKNKAQISKLGKLAVRNKDGKYEVKIIPDEKTMVDKFLPYTSIKEAQEKNGKMIQYPIYNFNNKSNVLSMTFFDRRGRDAQFVLLMNKKIEYVDPKTGLVTVLNFALGKNFNKQ